MKMMLMGICGALVLSSAAFAKPPLAGHPNLQAAHNHVKQAFEKITEAQKANEFDMDGHAAKAKELLEQAEKEIGMAGEAATKNAKK
jgi:hypothetical protein